MNYRDCQLDPGAGNLMFDWDRNGTTPQIVELMQTKFISGKLCRAADAGAANTYTFHIKEGSLFSTTEADCVNPVGGNFIVVAIYDTLVNMGHAQFSPNDNVQLKIQQGSNIDDNTSTMTWWTNNSIGYDVLDVSADTTIVFGSGARFLGMAPYYAGTGATNTNWKTVPSGILETVDPDLHDEIYYIGTATPLTATQSWVIAGGAGKFQGQRFRLSILGSIDTQGNTVAMFGRNFAPASEEMKGLTVWGTYDGSAWVFSYSHIV